MSERATRLHKLADQQIGELTELISDRDETALSRACSGREKLGDGSVAACSAHAAENYLRIAAFLDGAEHTRASRHAPRRGTGRISRLLGARARGGHRARSHGVHAPIGQIDRQSVLDRLSAGRQALGALAELTDAQLDAVPDPSEMRFCDGKRSLEQIVEALLKHQGHQVDAVRSALA